MFPSPNNSSMVPIYSSLLESDRAHSVAGTERRLIYLDHPRTVKRIKINCTDNQKESYDIKVKALP